MSVGGCADERDGSCRGTTASLSECSRNATGTVQPECEQSEELTGCEMEKFHQCCLLLCYRRGAGGFRGRRAGDHAGVRSYRAPSRNRPVRGREGCADAARRRLHGARRAGFRFARNTHEIDVCCGSALSNNLGCLTFSFVLFVQENRNTGHGFWLFTKFTGRLHFFTLYLCFMSDFLCWESTHEFAFPLLLLLIFSLPPPPVL